MFDFLQGLAFGLLMSVMPWFLTGLYDPRLVVPEELASRWQVILRYALVMPTVAMLLLFTSFWGGLGASVGGWLVGLAAVPVSLFVERRWRRWRARSPAPGRSSAWHSGPAPTGARSPPASSSLPACGWRRWRSTGGCRGEATRDPESGRRDRPRDGAIARFASGRPSSGGQGDGFPPG